MSVAVRTDIGHRLFEEVISTVATCRTGPGSVASQIFRSCCNVSRSVGLPAHMCAILCVSTAATALQRERWQLMLAWAIKHRISCCHLPAFGEHGNSAVDADASWTTAVVLCAAPGTCFDLQVRRLCMPCTPEGLARVHSSIVRDSLSCGRVQGTVTSWSCAVCAVSWPKGPILEDLAWMAAGLPAPSARGRQLHELRCSSVWRLPEGASLNRFGLWARAERASLEPAVAHKSH